MRRFAGVMAATLAVVALAGCQLAAPPTTPAPTAATPTHTPSSPAPDPTPTPMCTPEAGGEEFPCTQADYDQMKAKDALYAEAEAVFRAFFAENVRISRAGGATEPTDTMLATASGAYLSDAVGLFQSQHERGVRAEGVDPVVVSMRRLVGQSKGGSSVALGVCVDATGWAFYKDGAPVSEGKRAIDDTYFAEVDGVLKIIGADGREVESCD